MAFDFNRPAPSARDCEPAVPLTRKRKLSGFSHSPVSASTSSSASASAPTRFKFVTATSDLDEFQKQKTLREVRAHVMFNYLDHEKERKHEGGGTLLSAVEPQGNCRASQEVQTSLHAFDHGCRFQEQERQETIPNDQALAIYRRQRQPRPRDTRTSSPEEARRPKKQLHPSRSLPYPTPPANSSRVSKSKARPHAKAADRSLVTNVRKFSEAFTPLGPLRAFGTPLCPFRTLPQSAYPTVETERLKFQCSRLYGTNALRLSWVPSIVNSRPAYLSTLCITSSHLDVINNFAPELSGTTALKTEVIHLVQPDLNAPDPRTVDDATLMAVVQLLCCELIGGDEMVAEAHERGIQAIVNAKGGLGEQGVGGVLASILMVICLQSAIFRESPPQPVFAEYLSRLDLQPQPPTSPPVGPSKLHLPESPLYCADPDYASLARSRRCTPQLLQLICTMRDLIDLFTDESPDDFRPPQPHRPTPLSPSNQSTTTMSEPWQDHRIRSLVATLLAQCSSPYLSSPYHHYTGPRAAYIPHTHNAIRLVTLITLTAIARRTPFSAAAAALPSSAFTSAISTSPSPSYGSPVSPTTTTTTSGYPGAAEAAAASGVPPVLAALKNELEHSDLSECWGDMAGMLFWVALVGAAAARDAGRGTAPRTTIGKERDQRTHLRKWLIAHAVRCSILLGFEHGPAVVGALAKLGEVVKRCGGESNGGLGTGVLRGRTGSGGERGFRALLQEMEEASGTWTW